MNPFRLSDFSPLVAIGTLYKREVWRFMKVWNQTMLAPCITSALFLTILNLAMGGASRTVGELSYDQFVVPGLIMMAVVQNAFANTSSSLILSKFQGVIIDILTTPFKGWEITLAIALGGVTRGIVVAFACMIALYLYVPFTLHSAGWALYFLLISSMFMSVLGCLAGLIANDFEHMAAITNYLITPLAFLSGTFYSIQNLPHFWQQVSHLDPFFWMINGFRYAITGHSDGDILPGAIGLLVLTALFYTITQQAFVKGWRLKS